MVWHTAEQCEVHEPGGEPETGSLSQRFYHISELAALPAPRFLIDNLYVEKTFNLLYGPPKSGKTHIASQIAYDAALGLPHFGRTAKQVGTLILAGEGELAIGLRAKAFAKYHKTDLQELDIAVLAERLDLVAKDQTAVVHAVARHYEKLKNPGAILLDPWGKFMRSGDENSSVDVGCAIETTRLIMEETGCTLFGVHHTPASTTQRPRGHTSLLADVELAASVVKTGRTRTLTVNDARFVQEGTVIGFSLEVVRLDDCDLSACVVIPEAEAQQDSRPKRSPNEEIVWQALQFVYNVRAENGGLTPVILPQRPVHQPVQAVLTAAVQDEFARRYGTDRTTSSHAINTRFGEARKGLERKGYCGFHNEFVWPTF